MNSSLADERDPPEQAPPVQADAAAPGSQAPGPDEPGAAPAAGDEARGAEPGTPAGPTPGEQLRAERERQGLSVGEVARQLKLAPRQVEALEGDDHASLPGSVFVRGFLRNYARALGLDAEALVRQAFGEGETAAPAGVAAATGPVTAASSLPEKSPLNVPVESGSPRRRNPMPWIAAGVVLAVAAVAAAVLLGGRGPATAPPADVVVAPLPLPVQPSETAAADAAPSGTPAGASQAREAEAVTAPSGAEPDPSPAAAEAAPAAAAPAAVIGSRGPEMRFSFSRESWVEIRDGDGRVIFSQLNPEGSERVVRGKPPLELVVGNASGVALAYRGKPVDLGPHTRTDVARLTLE